MTGSARTTTRGFLALAAIILFARIYYIINESKTPKKDALHMMYNNNLRGGEKEDLPFLFAIFLLVLAGMPLLR